MNIIKQVTPTHMVLYLIMEPIITAMSPMIATTEAAAAEPLTRAVSA